MEKIVLNKKGATISQKIVRYTLIVLGGIFFIMPHHFAEDKTIYLVKVLGVLIFAPAIANPFSIFGQNRKLILTDDFVKTTEESIHFIEYFLKLISNPKTSEGMTATRTAYWHTINKAFLTRFYLRVYHESGIYENFRIPYLNREEFEELRSEIFKKSEEHNFPLVEKPWWKIPC